MKAVSERYQRPHRGIILKNISDKIIGKITKIKYFTKRNGKNTQREHLGIKCDFELMYFSKIKS